MCNECQANISRYYYLQGAQSHLTKAKYLVNKSHTVWYKDEDSHDSVRDGRASAVLPGEILQNF